MKGFRLKSLGLLGFSKWGSSGDGTRQGRGPEFGRFLGLLEGWITIVGPIIPDTAVKFPCSWPCLHSILRLWGLGFNSQQEKAKPQVQA